jgi:regulator of protease activity HflC (stomatin/prohibitin superfamily)
MKKIVALIMLLSLTGCGYTTVDTGYRGVETHFGKVVSESLPEGLYWYNPFTSDVIQIDTRIQKWDGQTTAYTRDVQQATVLFTLNYRLDPTKAHIVYQSVGTDWAAKLVGQVVHESIKREFGQHEAVDMVSQRDKASRSIEAEVTAKLADRSVVVTGFQLTNIDYTNEFEHAVEAKVVAQQKAIEEANRTKQIEEQKTQAILRAEGEAESIRIRANALAQNAKLVEWEAVQKWDGKMPQYMLGGAVPFIQMPAK